MPKISHERWKVYGNVFDGFTERLLFKLGSQGHYVGLKSPISIGKEANIFSAERKDGSKVIVKIYRLESCNFNKMYDYIRQDPRYMNNIKKKRREVIFSWTQREYRNLFKAREVGVRVPTVYAIAKHILVMEHIGETTAAPQCKNSMPKTLAGRKAFFDTCIKYIIVLWKKAKIVHGDLSKYNILNDHDQPVFIDFSQGTAVEAANAIELLQRDVKNVVTFAERCGIKLDAEKIVREVVGRET